MKSFKIYKYTNLITGQGYVGKTFKTLEERAGRNLRNYHACQKFWEAIQHYGTDCWKHEILWDGLTLDEANIYEQVEIQDNETIYPYGYNQTFGGDGCSASDETCRRISESVSKTFAENPEIWREAQKNATEAATKHNTGKSLSKEHKQAISNANKGKKRSKPIHNRSAIWDDVEEVIRLYTVELKTTTEIALMYALSSGSSVCVLLKANGIKLSRSRKPTRCDIWNRQSEVVSLYTQEFKSTKEIADMFEVSTETVLKVLKSNGVEELRSKKVAAWRHQDEIINLYTAEMKNINEIATIFKTSSDVVSRILKSNSVPTRKIENQNHPYYGKPAYNRSPQFTQAHELFLSLPPEMSVVEKRKHIQENVDGVTKGTITRWVQKWANITGIQPTHPDYERTHKFFLSLPADMNLNEKRKFLREKMPHVNRRTINKWVRKWQSEIAL